MDTNWNDSLPIYRQLRDRVVAMILEGVLNDGDPLPSVRSVAAEYRLNPLTVLKGYQQLVDENLVEKRRGRGMFVTEGARRALLKDERQLFLEEEWPKIASRIHACEQKPMPRCVGVAVHVVPRVPNVVRRLRIEGTHERGRASTAKSIGGPGVNVRSSHARPRMAPSGTRYGRQ